MYTRITSDLLQLERDENVRILYACESGSRAWGFPSADSDYDVRFIYVRPVEWYLSIDVEDRRDVIERPIVDEIDLSGWDLRKALRLLRKSNPPLLEWLGSPIVYLERGDAAARLRELVQLYYSPISSMYHYLHMAEKNHREYLKRDRVRTKKYFYVLRPLLALRWIEQERGVVPMEFGRLLETIEGEEELLREIDLLLEAKRSGAEMDDGPRIDCISNFIDTELARLATLRTAGPGERPGNEPLNVFFREVVGG